jgi:hypothetical protein
VCWISHSDLVIRVVKEPPASSRILLMLVLGACHTTDSPPSVSRAGSLSAAYAAEQDGSGADAEHKINGLLFRLWPERLRAENNWVRCRGSICRLSPPEGGINQREWTERLQTDPEAFSLISQWSFEDATYVRLEPNPAVVAGKRTGMAIWTEFQNSGAVRGCKEQYRESGSLVLSLKFSPSSREFSINMRGTLRDKPIAQCVKDALASIAAHTSVPADVSAVPMLPLVVEVP